VAGRPGWALAILQLARTPGLELVAWPTRRSGRVGEADQPVSGQERARTHVQRRQNLRLTLEQCHVQAAQVIREDERVFHLPGDLEACVAIGLWGKFHEPGVERSTDAAMSCFQRCGLSALTGIGPKPAVIAASASKTQANDSATDSRCQALSTEAPDVFSPTFPAYLWQAAARLRLLYRWTRGEVDAR